MAKAIMVMGTMSNVGKSIVVAGLCRVLKKDGYRVAPFKSQNMALNSYITKDGLEMGRAQVVQAEAAMIEPDVRMNPILLKPTNDTGSQVIINGKVDSVKNAVQYYKNKKEYIPIIKKAYESLSEEYDIIVIEGAGSPAEINLKENDIVNMGMAKLADAPVILVGDIDRGGVFAQLYGTIELLEEDEKDRIKGLIINKFRGDISILKPGLDMIEEKTKKEVLGVVPFMHIDIDDEDSLSDRFKKKQPKGLVDIVVVRLPRISNFTDFNVFEYMDMVSLRYVDDLEGFGNPDMIILPGTKNTIEDLLWLRQSGLEAKILKEASLGKIVFGICGGYQMLGKTITDENGVENKGSIRAMELLSMETFFENEKCQEQVNVKLDNINGVLSDLNGKMVSGYEIHMGRSECKDKVMSSQNIYGSYIHGFFDAPFIADTVVKCILNKKGIAIEELTNFNLEAYKETQYDLLENYIRNSIDMDKIYSIIEI